MNNNCYASLFFLLVCFLGGMLNAAEQVFVLGTFVVSGDRHS